VSPVYHTASPLATTAAVQGWLSWLPAGTKQESVIGGDQGGKVYSVDAATGGLNWSVTLTGADGIEAPIAAQLLQWSDATFQAAYTADVLFVATRNSSTTTNKLFALSAMDGTVLWSFNGTVSLNNMDYIVGMPWVDYARNYVYVVSRSNSGAQPSLWVINSLNGALVTSFSLGDIEASPTMSVDGNTLYVVTTSGNLYAVDMSTLAYKWTETHYAALGSAVQGFIWENGDLPGRLYFSTANGYVWSLQDPGAGVAPPNPASPLWKTVVAGPSTPLPMDKLYVGSSDGKVHQLNLTSGADEKQFTVGSGAYQVGDVSTETGSEIFVPTTEGTLYKLPVPLP
jgi:outer membrane protein assembly factor BamB